MSNRSMLALQRLILEKDDWATLSYGAFVSRLGVTLTPGQRALTLVAFDGLEPRDLPPELREYARRIFGPLDVLPPGVRDVLVGLCGGRGGKSYTLGALRIAHLAFTCPLTTLAPGEVAVALIVAPDLRLARQDLNYVRGALPKDRIANDTQDALRVTRADRHTVSIECLPATRGGASLRGRSLVGAVLDECAFFRDDSYQVNDVELFRAIRPRVLPGGQVCLLSTPWAETGLIRDEFVANHPEPWVASNERKPGVPHRALAAHAPTLLLRDVPEIRSVVEAEEARDPVNASREFGARFLAAGSGQFFDVGALTRGVRVEPSDRRLRALGADLAFVRDSAAFVVVERVPGGLRTLEVLELRPEGEALKPSEVLAAMVELARRWAVEAVVGDQHYAESAREACANAGLAFVDVPGGAGGKAEQFQAARKAVHEARCELPESGPLVGQLREVQARPTAGGALAIAQPRKAGGGHGDVASAWVAAVWYLERLELPALDDLPTTEADAWVRRIEERIFRSSRSADEDIWGA